VHGENGLERLLPEAIPISKEIIFRLEIIITDTRWITVTYSFIQPCNETTLKVLQK